MIPIRRAHPTLSWSIVSSRGASRNVSIKYLQKSEIVAWSTSLYTFLKKDFVTKVIKFSWRSLEIPYAFFFQNFPTRAPPNFEARQEVGIEVAGGGGWILQNGSTSVKFLISALLSGIYTISIVSMRRWGERIRARGRGKGRKIAAPCNIDFRDEYGRPWCLVAGTNALAAELVFQIRNFEPPLGRY